MRCVHASRVVQRRELLRAGQGPRHRHVGSRSARPWRRTRQLNVLLGRPSTPRPTRSGSSRCSAGSASGPATRPSWPCCGRSADTCCAATAGQVEVVAGRPRRLGRLGRADDRAGHRGRRRQHRPGDRRSLADILGVVEAENRVVLKRFTDAQLPRRRRPPLSARHAHRRQRRPRHRRRPADPATAGRLGTMRSHVDDTDAEGVDLQPRLPRVRGPHAGRAPARRAGQPPQEQGLRHPGRQQRTPATPGRSGSPTSTGAARRGRRLRRRARRLQRHPDSAPLAPAARRHRPARHQHPRRTSTTAAAPARSATAPPPSTSTTSCCRRRCSPRRPAAASSAWAPGAARTARCGRTTTR